MNGGIQLPKRRRSERPYVVRQQVVRTALGLGLIFHTISKFGTPFLYEFMLFQSEFNDQVDMTVYGDGWLSNDIQFLGSNISKREVELMEQAEQGEMDIPYHRREELVRATTRFHRLRWTFCTEPRNGVDIKCVTCDCHQYYVRRWCYNSAYLQHKHALLLEAQVIPTTTKNGWRVSGKTRDRQYLAAAKARRKQKEYSFDANSCDASGINEDDRPNVLTQE
jgi:hypothetical protein